MASQVHRVRRSVPGLRAACLVIALTVVTSFLLATPAVAQVESSEEPKDCTEEVHSEARALALAKECDRAITVDSELSEYSEVVAQPDGRMRLTTHVEPVRARKESGDWAPIDTTLRTRSDGSITPVSTVLPVVISGGGEEPFASIRRDGKQFGLKWPGRLPKPAVAGDTATYAEVLPGVDLTVTATATGFSHNVVVKSREAAQNAELAKLKLGIVTDGVTARRTAAGGIEVAGGSSAEPLLSAPRPMMWDSPRRPAASPPGESSGAEDKSHPKLAPVGVEVEANTLTLIPDAAVLAGVDTAYPVIIDPLWTGGKRDGVWATVSEKYPNTAYWKTSHLLNKTDFGDAGAGRTCDSWTDFTCHTPSYRMRSYFRMNTEFVSRYSSRVVTSATFKLKQEHAWVCQDSSPKSNARIWRTSGFTTTTTWSDQPWWSGDYATSGEYANYGAACTGGPATVEFDAKQMVQFAQDNRDYSVNIAMRAIDESTVAQWKRFDSATATLNIYYNTRPGVPTGRSADGRGCGSSSSPVWVLRKSPYVQAKVTDGDGTVRAQYEVFNSAGTRVASYTSGFVTSGTTHKWTISSSLYESTYHWRVRGYDGSLYSSWSSYCYFTVDSKPPSLPEIDKLTSQDDIDKYGSVTLRFSSTDANGITKFEYGVDREVRETAVGASENTATVTLSNLSPGRHLIYVWARDPAGHVSARGFDDVIVGHDFDPILRGAWRLNGDALDDSGFHRDLTLGSEASWVADRHGDVDSALSLPGTTGGCSQTAEAVIQTDKAYSVAAWVQLGSADGPNPTVLSQAGTNQPGFFLQLDSETNKWRFIMPSADTASPTYLDVVAPTAATQGWTHVAATVDPVAKVLRLYLDGDLVASAELTASLWNATGPLLVGCAGRSDGFRYREFTGAIDYVGVWQGLLTEAEIERAMTDLSAVQMGAWALQGDGSDASGLGNDLVPQGGYDWVENQYGMTNGALSLDGAQGSCAKTAGPVLRTDDSFSVSLWAKVSDGGGTDPTLIGQTGSATEAFALGWARDTDRWKIIMSSQDTFNGGEVWTSAESAQSVVQGTWQHLAGVYDADDEELRLYLNGELEKAVPMAAPGWNATGAFHVGCLLANGTQWNWVKGAISDVQAYRGPLTGEQIKTLYGNPPVDLKAEWKLDGPGSSDPDPALLRDSSGKGHDLTISGDYTWTDDRHFTPEGSLSLQLAEGSCARTAGTVVRTDESFTVAAWVKADTLPAEGTSTVLSQATPDGSRFRLKHLGGNGWAFELADGPGASPQWHTATADVESDPQWLGWVHVAGVYDRSAIGKQVQLYVNGRLQATASGPATPWHADGEMLLGCARQADGTNNTYLESAVDEVQVWSSTVDPARIEQLANS